MPSLIRLRLSQPTSLRSSALMRLKSSAVLKPRQSSTKSRKPTPSSSMKSSIHTNTLTETSSASFRGFCANRFPSAISLRFSKHWQIMATCLITAGFLLKRCVKPSACRFVFSMSILMTRTKSFQSFRSRSLPLKKSCSIA